MIMLANKRRAHRPRFPVRVPVLTEQIGAAIDPGLGETENLSRGGLALRHGMALVAGAPVGVTLRLRSRSPLILTGTVAWTHPHPDLPGWAMGVRFSEDLSEEMVVEIADEEHPPWAAPRA
jgi:hypothetical protein